MIIRIAQFVSSAQMLCRLKVTCNVWKLLLEDEEVDWLWKRHALHRFPRLEILLAQPLQGMIPSFYKLYQSQWAAERPLKRVRTCRSALADFMCTVDFGIRMTGTSDVTKCLSTTTAQLTMDPKLNLVPFSQAWTDSTRRFMTIPDDVRVLYLLELSLRYDLKLNVYISKQLQTIHVYRGMSTECENTIIMFQQYELCESATRPLAHSATRPLAHSATRPFCHSPTRPFCHSPTHPFCHSPILPLAHSHIRPFAYQLKKI